MSKASGWLKHSCKSDVYPRDGFFWLQHINRGDQFRNTSGNNTNQPSWIIMSLSSEQSPWDCWECSSPKGSCWQTLKRADSLLLGWIFLPSSPHPQQPLEPLSFAPCQGAVVGTRSLEHPSAAPAARVQRRREKNKPSAFRAVKPQSSRILGPRAWARKEWTFSCWRKCFRNQMQRLPWLVITHCLPHSGSLLCSCLLGG